MSAKEQYIRTCSIWRALEVVGDKPTLLLLESYWLGKRRFSEFQNQTGLLKTVISDRLSKLISAGCFEKKIYSERPIRHEYRGTEKFYDLYPVALSMLHWENKWGTHEGKIQVNLKHKTCGAKTNPSAICVECRGAIDPRDVSWTGGPGVGMMAATYTRRRRKTGPETPTQLFDEIADIIGDRWSSLIIRSVFTNLNSFQDICDDTGIATNILSERLERLCGQLILEKRGSVYKLKPKGRDIYPILLTLMQWGDKWYSAPEGPPLKLTHNPCRNPLTGIMACSHCFETISMNDIIFEYAKEAYLKLA